VAVAPTHRHVVDLSSRAVRCACQSCAILFPRLAGGRFRSIPDRVLTIDRTVDAAVWSALGVPVYLSYLWFDSTLDRWVAHVPSPAGVVEVELKDGAWGTRARRAALRRLATTSRRSSLRDAAARRRSTASRADRRLLRARGRGSQGVEGDGRGRRRAVPRRSAVRGSSARAADRWCRRDVRAGARDRRRASLEGYALYPYRRAP
jgi:hypothetical protein